MRGIRELRVCSLRASISRNAEGISRSRYARSNVPVFPRSTSDRARVSRINRRLFISIESWTRFARDDRCRGELLTDRVHKLSENY